MTIIMMTCVFGEDSKLCEVLQEVQGQECKDNPSKFCQLVDVVEQRYCEQVNEMNMMEESSDSENKDWGCVYVECPPNLPYCKNGECFDKPQNSTQPNSTQPNSTQPIDWACTYVECPPNIPYCKNGECLSEPQNVE